VDGAQNGATGAPECNYACAMISIIPACSGIMYIGKIFSLFVSKLKMIWRKKRFPEEIRTFDTDKIG
jgi:hypothetical protein